ncbi:MAG: hypothetical protein U0Z44_17310 [Kouleothrix sp.]|nr:hypothetical protein [Kouleothrix sp.]
MGPTALFIVFVALIAAVLFAVWRYWMNLSQVSPEEEEFDERMAALNERQANRISDEFLAQPMSDEEAWRIMVRRGMRLNMRQRRQPRTTQPRRQPRTAQPRRERYGGELSRRVDERRDRFGDPPRRPPARRDSPDDE